MSTYPGGKKPLLETAEQMRERLGLKRSMEEPDLEALDLDDLVVPPPQGEWHSLHEKCEAEIAALRAEATGYAEQAAQTRLDADREIDSLATSLAKALDGKAAAEAALATERARALEEARTTALMCVFDAIHEACGGEIDMEPLRERIDRNLRALSASPPPASAPQGEERARALEVVALLTEAHDWGVGASNRFPYLSHGMLCMAIRTRGVERPCDCGLVEWYDRVVAATASPPPAPAPQGEAMAAIEDECSRVFLANHLPLSPAPQGEERCETCARERREDSTYLAGHTCTGRAPRAEEGT